MTMLIRRLHKLPLLFLWVLCLLTSPASSVGYVWCVSDDGHATLETSLAGNCGIDNPVSTGFNASELFLTTSDGDCGDCLDIFPSCQLGSPRSRQEAAPVSVPSPFAPVIVAATYHSLPEQFQSNPLATRSSRRTSDPILHHRTIVLLI